MKMDDSLLSDYEQLKISAFSKYKHLKFVSTQVTIGHNSKHKEAQETPRTNISEKTTLPKKNEQNNNSEYLNILRKSEMHRSKQVRNKVNNHIAELEKFSKQNQMYHEEKLILAQEGFLKYQRQKEFEILEASDEFDKNISDEHARIEKLNRDMEEQRKRRKLELKQAAERKITLLLNIEKINKHHQDFLSVYETIPNSIKECLNKETLREKLGENYKLVKCLLNQMEDIRLKCSNGSVTDEDVRKCSDILTNVTSFSVKLKEVVQEINENRQAKTQVVNLPTDPVPSAPNTQQISSQESKLRINPEVSQLKNDNSNSEKINMSKYISVNTINFYCETMSFLENHIRSFLELEEDNSQKQFKFDCKKAVNIPVNALSGLNSEHILDKYNRLLGLLKGQNVIVSNKTINASKHPQGIAFCMDLLAKKLVLQGDLMVSSNPESAFCYASLIVSLWNEFPTFGWLVLAYFYKLCPILVPYYVPREVGESDEDFYKKSGYQYIEGQIETQDKFLKRITGNL